jgi:hypothetical protein
MLKIKMLFAVAGGLILIGWAAPPPASAINQPPPTTQSSSGPCSDKSGDERKSCEACNKKNANAQNCLDKNPITRDINLIVNALAGLVGVVCVAMIVLGGIRYSLARNNPQDISAARSHIINAVFALISFMLIWSLLQYLIPGGVFKS